MAYLCFALPAWYNRNTLKHLTILAALTCLGAGCASAQLAFYVDEAGRRVYINGNPTPTPAPKTSTKSSPKTLPISDPKIEDVIQQMAARHGVDPNLIKAIIKTESNNNPKAVSSKGARGLMQLMPPTARDLGVTNSLDPAQNVDGGVRYLKQLMAQYGGNLELSLAAYNAGPGAVGRHGGVPPYRETQQYVKKIGTLYGSLRTQAEMPESHRSSIVRYVDEDGRVVYTNTR
jgi:soluble lytic murein transglycosylase-like protein